MRQSNPAVIPRNHQVEAVITAAVNGDFDPFHTLLGAVTRPFEMHADYMAPPKPHEVVQATFVAPNPSAPFHDHQTDKKQRLVHRLAPPFVQTSGQGISRAKQSQPSHG